MLNYVKKRIYQSIVKYVDLWVSDYILPSTHLVVEMFPYFKDLDIPVLNGRPLLNPLEEKTRLAELVNYIKDLSKSDGLKNG